MKRALLLLLLAGCSRESPPAPATSTTTTTTTSTTASASATATATTPLSVILITVDSLRADMPWAGYPRAIAPNLTKLANERAVVYSRAYSVSSFTSKSLPGLLTSRYPSELARDGVFFTRYKPTNVTLGDALEAAHVPAAAGMAHAYLAKGYAGIDHGFARWETVPGITFDYNTDPYVTSPKLEALAEAMLSDPKIVGGERFFTWLHFMDPHAEYQSHKESPHWGPKLRDLYDEEVFYTDLYIGRLLDFIAAQPWAKRAAVVITADHGEAFGEHFKWKHAQELYETHVHVPLLVALPGQAHRVIDQARSAIDLAPTILDLLGVVPPASMEGKSFAAELRGGEPEAREVVCDLPQDEYNDRRRALIRDDWKLIVFGKDERMMLFRLSDDPGETNDLFAKEPDTAKAMVARYRELSKGIRDVPPIGGIPKH